MSIEKYLGKISSVRFGNGVGYQEANFGIEFEFSFDGGGVGDCARYSVWSPSKVSWSQHCKWTEQDRDEKFIEICRYIDTLLYDAKVNDVYKLKGIPVEISVENRTFKDFRILKEVL